MMNLEKTFIRGKELRNEGEVVFLSDDQSELFEKTSSLLIVVSRP